MKSWVAGAGTIVLSVATPAFAHRLDEYLQATTISVQRDRMQAQIRLVPGVAVFPAVFAAIDSNADGILSEGERHAYGQRVLGDLSLTVDGDAVPLRLVSSRASSAQAMREGLGEIRLDVEASVPLGGHDRRLVFENHHEGRIAAYLVNVLVPSDPAIRIAAQDRNYDQSFYRVDYVDESNRSASPSFGPGSSTAGWLGAAALVLFARLALRWRPEVEAADNERGSQ